MLAATITGLIIACLSLYIDSKGSKKRIKLLETNVQKLFNAEMARRSGEGDRWS